MTTPTTSNEIQNKGLNKTHLVILILSIMFCFLLLLISLLTFLYVRSQNEVKVNQQLVNARQLIDQSKFSDAILLLNEIIASNPNNLEAYRLRSMAYGNSRSNNFSEQQTYFVNALHDLDKMIALQPGNGNNYVDRDLLFRELANMAPDSASEFALYELANDNVEKAIKLGVTSDYSYVYRHHARNLIESNHCAEGLKETQNIISQAQPGDPNMNNYHIYLTEAYICLGDLDKALETAQLINCENPTNSCQSMYLAEIYFQSGETEKTLELLNRLINLDPTYGGWRYFMRAAIYYEQGEKDLAIQDLTTGDNYSWYSNGVYWYVKAQIAFEEGDEQNGMLYLQYAESTLDIEYTPFRQKVLKELKARGGSPLTISPQIPLATTPIP